MTNYLSHDGTSLTLNNNNNANIINFLWLDSIKWFITSTGIYNGNLNGDINWTSVANNSIPIVKIIKSGSTYKVLVNNNVGDNIWLTIDDNYIWWLAFSKIINFPGPSSNVLFATGTNGLITDINISGSAAISISKLNWYPSDGQTFLSGDWFWKKVNYVELDDNVPILTNGTVTLYTDNNFSILNTLGFNHSSGAGMYVGDYCPVMNGNSNNKCVEFFYQGIGQSEIDNTGALVPFSSKKIKTNIRKKNVNNNNKYLNRILNLPIYTYTLIKSSEHNKNQLIMGVIYEDIKKIFNGYGITKHKFIGNNKCNIKNCIECNKNKGVRYNDIFLYNILAFQEFHEWYIKTINNLTNIINDNKKKIDNLYLIISDLTDKINFLENKIK